MNLIGLRVSGILQASIAALLLGFLLKNVPFTISKKLWPYLLFAFCFSAQFFPWLIALSEKIDLNVRTSISLGIIFVPSLSFSAYWLSATPYYNIGFGLNILIILWFFQFLISIIFSIFWPNEKHQEEETNIDIINI